MITVSVSALAWLGGAIGAVGVVVGAAVVFGLWVQSMRDPEQR